MTQETPKAVLRDAKPAIIQLQKRINRLTAEALALIGKYPELERVLALPTGITGIAETSAIYTHGRTVIVA
ncbi:MAG: hypothetical protein Q7T96_16265 [Methylobacter sp.]|nr:hypothetical protein [Methylobacter sp.]